MVKDKSFHRKKKTNKINCFRYKYFKIYREGCLKYKMKKEIYIILIIVICMIILHVVSQKYTKNFFDEIYSELDYISQKIQNDEINNNELEKNIENIMSKWSGKYNLIACYVEHDELEKVQVELTSINANIKVNDYEQCAENIEQCKFILKHIEDKDSFKIMNIF